MRRYRFPGQTSIPTKCNQPKECKPYITIKVCPPLPYIKDRECRSNVYDRAIVHYVPESLKCKYKAKFLLETFSGLVLYPRNLERFCGYDFKDGEVVAVEAEIIEIEKPKSPCEPQKEEPCKEICKPKQCEVIVSGCKCKKSTCEKNKCETVTTMVTTTVSTECDDTVDGAIPVKIFRILRVWKLDLKTLVGTVLSTTDSNGVSYHIVREIVDLASGIPYATLVENVLNTQTYVINYELFNIMGVSDPQHVMQDLEGKVIQAEYVDYGKETPARLGIPVVVFGYKIVG
jgi:hypothetical protein